MCFNFSIAFLWTCSCQMIANPKLKYFPCYPFLDGPIHNSNSMLKYVLPTALITRLYIRFFNNGSWSYSCSDSRVVGNLANSFISCVHTVKRCLVRVHSTSDAQEALCGEVFSCCYSTVVNHEYMLVTIGVKMLVPVSVWNH